ncbi:MAG: glutamyl-tRNA reductase [Myxococcales bacterium]|nr:glutamyl-tRNA reductase [Myxococcales bacterium]
MKIAVVGLSHHTAPVALRERLARSRDEIPETLETLQSIDGITEACVLSTCNRVEYYVSGVVEAESLVRELKLYLLTESGVAISELDQHLYVHTGEDCVRHLFRVASSLDSMVVGEPQILGQVKQAFQTAEGCGAVGSRLGRAFQKAFSVAKRVRTETGIAENAVSMSFAAVELGRGIFEDLSGKEVLLLGAGEMATLAARHLVTNGVSRVRVVSRTLATAAKLAEQVGGVPSTMNDLEMLLAKVDIVICSTAASGYVVNKLMMSRVVRERRYRPILFVDIAVPRDVDPKVASVDNCFVYDVDDLTSVLDTNRQQRQNEASAAETLIQGELLHFSQWSKSQEVVPVIKALRAQAMAIADHEVARTLTNMRQKDKRTQQSIRAMGNAIVNKLLHPVLTHLRTTGGEGDPQPYVEALSTLFELNLESSTEDSHQLSSESGAAEDTSSMDERETGSSSDDIEVAEVVRLPIRNTGVRR